CVPVPEAVKEETGLYQQMNFQKTDLSDKKFSSLEQVRQEAEEMEGMTYNQFQLPETIRLPEQDMYLLYMGNLNDYYEQAEKVRDQLIPDYDEIPASQKKEERDEIKEYDLKDYQCSVWDDTVENKELEDYERYITLDNKGFISYGKEEDMPDFEMSSSHKVLSVNVQQEPVPDVSYELVNGETESLKDAIAFAERKVNAEMHRLNGDIYQYQVQWIYVIQAESGRSYYRLVLEKVYKGAFFDSSGYYLLEKEELAAEQKYLYSGHQVLLDIYCPEMVGFYREMYSSVPEETEQVDSYLSLQSAMDIISETFARKSIFQLDEVKLCYTLRQENLLNLETGKRKYPWDGIMQEWIDDTCEARPTWVFEIDQKTYPNGAENANNSENSYELVVLVDAVDGTCQYYTGMWGK
ncbi:MAG: hypothetical protein ACI39W_03775, partial [Brotaphodocola sp.]